MNPTEVEYVGPQHTGDEVAVDDTFLTKEEAYVKRAIDDGPFVARKRRDARNEGFDNTEGIKYEPLRSGRTRFNVKRTPPENSEIAGDIKNDHKTKPEDKRPPKSHAKSRATEPPPTYKESDPDRFQLDSFLRGAIAKLTVDQYLVESPYARQRVKNWIKDIESRAKWETKISKPAWLKRPAAGDDAQMLGDDDDADSTRATIDLQPEIFTANTTAVRASEACVDGLPVEAIVDSGASHTMISQHVVRKLGRLDELMPAKGDFITASGKKCRPWGVLRRLGMQIGNLSIPMEVRVVSTDAYESLFASDWLHAAGAIIDYSRGLISYNLSPEHREHRPFTFTRGGRVATFAKGGSLHVLEIMTTPEPDLAQDTISNEGPIESKTSGSEDQAPNNHEETVEKVSDLVPISDREPSE